MQKREEATTAPRVEREVLWFVNLAERNSSNENCRKEVEGNDLEGILNGRTYSNDMKRFLRFILDEGEKGCVSFVMVDGDNRMSLSVGKELVEVKAR